MTTTNSHIITAKVRLLDALAIAKQRAIDLETGIGWIEPPDEYVRPIGELYERVQAEVERDLAAIQPFVIRVTA